jgi:hypothetical protein
MEPVSKLFGDQLKRIVTSKDAQLAHPLRWPYTSNLLLTGRHC